MKKRMRILCTVPLMTALTVICAWITIPFPVPLTLQTLAVYLSVLLLGGKGSFLCILLYISLGAVGLPVFSSMQGGPGVLFGATGGYISAFLLIPLVYSVTVALLGKSLHTMALGCALGTVALYTFGTLWYCLVYGGLYGNDFLTALKVCVLPFVLPDTAKLLLALVIYGRIKGIERSERFR